MLYQLTTYINNKGNKIWLHCYDSDNEKFVCIPEDAPYDGVFNNAQIPKQVFIQYALRMRLAGVSNKHIAKVLYFDVNGSLASKPLDIVISFAEDNTRLSLIFLTNGQYLSGMCVLLDNNSTVSEFRGHKYSVVHPVWLLFYFIVSGVNLEQGLTSYFRSLCEFFDAVYCNVTLL